LRRAPQQPAVDHFHSPGSGAKGLFDALVGGARQLLAANQERDLGVLQL
jgi:hypothetical protein